MRRLLITAFVSSIISLVSLTSAPVGAISHPWYYPLLKLGPSVYHRFEFCVLPGQSRSTFTHPNLGDNSKYGSSGVFQMEPILWNAWAPLAGVHVVIWRATLYQQALVAATVYKHDGFTPWKGC
jgi:hypothetical protein